MSWPLVDFANVAVDVSRGNTKTLQSEFMPEGQYPIIDQGQSFIAGYTDDASRVCKAEVPAIVFGDHTKCLKFVEFPFCMGADGTKVLSAKEGVDPKYLFYALQTVHIPDAGYSRHFKYLKEARLPLPPLPEQQRIATILDLAERLRLKRQEALETLTKFPPAVLHNVFPHGPGAPLVNARAHVPPPPAGARWVQLTEIARLATGHTPDRKVADYWDGDIPWLSLTDIRALDGLEADRTTQSVTQSGIDNSSSVILPPGTVCLARTASVGFATIMGRSMATSQDFVNWVCGPEIDPIYLLYALIASRAELRSLAPGSTHKTIYFPTVESFRILLPTMVVQKECADSIRRYWTAKTAMEKDSEALDTLFASLQHRAFNGEL